MIAPENIDTLRMPPANGIPAEAELARREDRDYEPASVLHEHMSTKRQTAAKKPRRRHQ